MRSAGTISRWMPPPECRDPGRWSQLRLVADGIAFTVVFPWAAMPVIVMVGVAAVGTFVLDRGSARRLRALAASRPGEDIGTFAWAFRHKAIDMWAVRAVWDALAPWTRIPGGHVPLRSSDRLIADLEVDPEDLFDVASEIADRLDCAAEGKAIVTLIEHDPTVGDLVEFLGSQTRRSGIVPG